MICTVCIAHIIIEFSQHPLLQGSVKNELGVRFHLLLRKYYFYFHGDDNENVRIYGAPFKLDRNARSTLVKIWIQNSSWN